jgi:hypothetical protein
LGDQPPRQVHRWRRTIETTEEDLVCRVFPHPTISEAMHDAVLDAYGRAIRILGRAV